MSQKRIKFNAPLLEEREYEYCKNVLESGKIGGGGEYTDKVEALLSNLLFQNASDKAVLLTNSCTSALEMSAMLAQIGPGDEVIMPSFTFVSTANAFVLRGAKIKFVDIDANTLNIDVNKIEDAITSQTKAIVPVHYAGVPCNMNAINYIAKQYQLAVIEDAAQALGSRYKGQFAGTLSDTATFSFHETKNIVAGEGGALIVNRADWIERAKILRDKGTNRNQFVNGLVSKYSWVDIGSSYAASEMLAAVLLAQLEKLDRIIELRSKIIALYREALLPFEAQGYFKLPRSVSESCDNGHIFYIVCQTSAHRNYILKGLNAKGIQATFHYIPLHNSKFSQDQGFYDGALVTTERISECLIRLPLHCKLQAEDIEYICEELAILCSNLD